MRKLLIAATFATIPFVFHGSAIADGPSLVGGKPWVGALYPDSAKAQGHNDTAKAMAYVDDNPLIRWAYRVWCGTGYHNVKNVGLNQFADPLPNPKRDLVSPLGFYYREFKDQMPSGGVQFMDNAWFFGTDYVGAVVVKTPEGLLLFDALTNWQDMKSQIIDEMPKAGLNPADIKYIFIGHRHGDHIGGINLLLEDYAPDAIIVAGEPDKKWIEDQRASILDGTAPLPRSLGANPSAEEISAARARQLNELPSRVDVSVPPFEAVKTGVKRIDIGGGREVVTILNPGHTPGQISAIVPVERNGKEHKLFVWSGNDQLSEAKQYAISTDFARGVAEQEGADAFINTHPIKVPFSTTCGS